MLDFISASPSPFHRVENICRRLENRGYTRLYEGEAWKLEKGGKYYTVRNLSSVIAFRRPAREDFSIMILRAKFHLAQQSVESKRLERYRDTIDEYYGFVNEYPESKYMKDAQRIFAQSEKVVNKK